jgi:hypothetical protein
MLLFSMTRFLAEEQRQAARMGIDQSTHAGGWIPNYTRRHVKGIAQGWLRNAKHAPQLQTLRFIINNIAAS